MKKSPKKKKRPRPLSPVERGLRQLRFQLRFVSEGVEGVRAQNERSFNALVDAAIDFNRQTVVRNTADAILERKYGQLELCIWRLRMAFSEQNTVAFDEAFDFLIKWCDHMNFATVHDSMPVKPT